MAPQDYRRSAHEQDRERRISGIPFSISSAILFTAWLSVIALALGPAPASAEGSWYGNPCTARLAYTDSGDFVTLPARTAGCIVSFPVALVGSVVTLSEMGGYFLALGAATGTQYVVGFPLYLMEEAAIRIKSPTQTLETPEEYFERTRNGQQASAREPAEASHGGNGMAGTSLSRMPAPRD